ncbi:MAG: hypothetical protein GVY19_07885 [Bacteroidetes bacterium]|jgi:hypothetical protein|nr:hypothetical protein [Bacteroidota bacterium]
MTKKKPVYQAPISFKKNVFPLLLLLCCVLTINAQTFIESTAAGDADMNSANQLTPVNKKAVKKLNPNNNHIGPEQLSVQSDLSTGNVDVTLKGRLKKARLLVFCLDGNKLISRPLKSGSTNSFSNLLTREGIYMLEIVDDTKVLYIEKIVVN